MQVSHEVFGLLLGRFSDQIRALVTIGADAVMSLARAGPVKR